MSIKINLNYSPNFDSKKRNLSQIIHYFSLYWNEKGKKEYIDYDLKSKLVVTI